MQKRTFLIILIFIIFLGIVGFFLITNQNSIPDIEVEESENPDFVPFTGSDFGTVDLGEGISSGGSTVTIGRDTYDDFNAVDSNLAQVSNQPVAGYTLISKIIEITEDPKELVNDNLVETYNFFEFPNMKIGDSGEGVVALKTVLNRLFPEALLSTENTFDTATKNTLINFQTQNKLAADGIAGTGTKAKLNEIQGLSKNPKDFEPIIRQEERFTVRYQDKKTGFIYDLGIDDKKFEEILTTSFPAVQESFFANNGNSIVIRYVSGNDSINTYVGKIAESEDGIFLDGDFLPQGISFVSINSEGTKMVYLDENLRKTKITIFDFITEKKEVFLDSKFTEWLPQFSGPEMFSLTTRASALASGYSYKHTLSKKDSIERGVGGLTGLTTNYNPSGSKVLYSTNNSGKFIETYVYDFNEKTTLKLGIRTLSEKCIWTDNDNVLCAVPNFVTPEDYPDAWYKGEVSFNDRLWKVNTTNGLETIISTLRSSGMQEVDLINPIYKNGVLLFQNKHDYTLWMLDMRNS